MKLQPPTAFGWPEIQTLTDGRTVTVYSSKPPAWSARRAHLIRLLGVQDSPARYGVADGYSYADHQARQAREYAAQDSQTTPYHSGR
jgi:hypothetical protein